MSCQLISMRKQFKCMIDPADYLGLIRFEVTHPKLYRKSKVPKQQLESVDTIQVQSLAFDIVWGTYKDELQTLIDMVKTSRVLER